jgi:hypothetical protein
LPKEKRSLLLAGIRFVVVSVLLTSSVFYPIVTYSSGPIQEVSGQDEDVTGGEPSELDEPPPPEEEPPPPAECPPGTHPGTGTATFGECIPDTESSDQTAAPPAPPPSDQTAAPSSPSTNGTTPLPPGCLRTTAGTIYCPSNPAALPPQIPQNQTQPPDLNAVYVISTRGNFDLKTGNAMSSLLTYNGNKQGDGYNGKYKLSDISKLYENCPAEVALLVHGFDNSPQGALEKFDRAKMSIELNNYKIPIIGFSWDSNPQLDSTKDKWNVAKKIALGNGPILAQFIIDLKNQCYNTNIRIVGHSQGAQVIFAALLSIYSNPERVLLGPYVKDIHLLGAAVNHHRISTNHQNCGSFAVDFNEYPPVNQYRCVGKAIEAVVGDRFVYNLHSTEDRILFWAYEQYWGENHAALGRIGADKAITWPKNYVEQDVTDELPPIGDTDGDRNCEELMCSGFLPELETGENHFGFWGYRCGFRCSPDRLLLDDGALNIVVSNWRT